MIKRTIFILLGLVVIIGGLAGIKNLQFSAMKNGPKFQMPPETVTSAIVTAEDWERSLSSIGSLQAIKGVLVSAEVPGKVVSISFEAGTEVKANAVLVRLDSKSEQAQFAAAKARLDFAKIRFQRSKALLKKNTISQSEYDSADSEYKLAKAEAETIRVLINKKAIKAPFSGQLGLREVNLGQYLQTGDPVVTLQSLDPVFVNFSLPQQDLAKISVGAVVRLTSDAMVGKTVEGKITAISPEVDSRSRNISVQATVANPEKNMLPGMFVKVELVLPEKENVLVIPSMAVSFATFGNSVFLIEEPEANSKQGLKTLKQVFVRLGERRGDFVSVIEGVTEGDIVVSSGIFKLRNGIAVVVDNKLSPTFEYAPSVEDN